MRRVALIVVLVVVAIAPATRAQTPVGTEFQVNTYTTGYQPTPTVAADPAGNFAVVWASNGQDGDSFGIFGQAPSSRSKPAAAIVLTSRYLCARTLR